MGEAVEKVDRTTQAIVNILKELPSPPTTVADNKDILQKLKESQQLRSDSELEIADHLYASRSGYSHHALYIGDDKVIHYSEGQVRIDSFEVFKKSSKIRVIDSVTVYPREIIINRAYSRLSEKITI